MGLKNDPLTFADNTKILGTVNSEENIQQLREDLRLLFNGLITGKWSSK